MARNESPPVSGSPPTRWCCGSPTREGITKEAAAGLFDGSRGHGLGLSLAGMLVDGCGGRLLLSSTSPTTFEIHLLPAAGGAEASG
jgi:hypothetical protein